MSLKETLETNLLLHRKCKFGQIIAKITDEEDQQALERAMQMVRDSWENGNKYTTGISVSWIIDSLEEVGFSVHRDTVSAHINGKCCCK